MQVFTRRQPVASSALSPHAQVWVVNNEGIGEMVDCPVPRELTTADIQRVIADYRQAALNAVEAGFDGVEVHGGNGYLIDQFLRRSSNQRTDEYGGSLENRVRFAQQILEAISEAIGAERTGIRLAPYITQRGMDDPQVIDAILALAAGVNQKVLPLFIWRKRIGMMRRRCPMRSGRPYGRLLAVRLLWRGITPVKKPTNCYRQGS